MNKIKKKLKKRLNKAKKKISNTKLNMAIPHVDKDVCIGSGACVTVSPKVFKMNKDAKADVLEVNFESLRKSIN